MKQPPKDSLSTADYLQSILSEHAEEKRQRRYYNIRYRNLVLRAVLTLLSGIVLLAFLDSHGFRLLLVGLFLLGSGALLVVLRKP